MTTWITTMPWHSGATDEVAGSDGSPNSNTNGKDPYKIQGIETCIGAYEVLGNVVMDVVTGADGNPARDVYVCEDASTLSSNIATVRANYKRLSHRWHIQRHPGSISRKKQQIQTWVS